MIQIGVGEKNARNRAVAWRVAARLQLRSGFDLPRKVRRRVDQEPALSVGGNRDARLRLRRDFTAPGRQAIGACAIPLRQAAARRAPENSEAN